MNNNYTLIVTKEDGSQLNIQYNNLDALKDVAKRYNKKGCNVQIVQHVIVYEVTQYEK
jgi:hypothetical protein